MLSHDLQRLFFLGLTIIAGFGLGGCTLTRDLWQEDNANGRRWAGIPLTLEAFESDDRHTRVHLVVGRDGDMKIKVTEERFRVRSFRQGERLVFSLKDPSVVWLLDSVGGALPKERHELDVQVDADNDPVSVQVRVTLWPDSGKLFTPYHGARNADLSYEKYGRLLGILRGGVDRLGPIYTGQQRDNDVPQEQWAHHFRFAGWIAKDGEVNTDLDALEAAIDEALAARSWQPLDGMSAILEAVYPQQQPLPAWTVPMEQVVQVGALESMTVFSKWNEGGASPVGQSQRLSDFGNFKTEARISGRTPAPTYEFWPTVGRVVATPFAVTGDAVAWTTVVVTAPIWGPILLYPYLR